MDPSSATSPTSGLIVATISSPFVVQLSLDSLPKSTLVGLAVKESILGGCTVGGLPVTSTRSVATIAPPLSRPSATNSLSPSVTVPSTLPEEAVELASSVLPLRTRTLATFVALQLSLTEHSVSPGAIWQELALAPMSTVGVSGGLMPVTVTESS